MTGNSGGGMQTAYMMLTDDRIRAAVPCTWITSREAFMKTGYGQDGEQIIHGTIAGGLNYDDYISAFAPKPVMIGAVESDFFSIEGTLQSYERARKVYGFYGCENFVKLSLTPGTHSYNDRMRQDAVNWFLEHLAGKAGDFPTGSGFATEADQTLQCTSSGQVNAEYADARSVFELNLDYLRAHRYPETRNPLQLREDVERTLGIPQGHGEIRPRVISDWNRGRIRYRDVFFFSEEDVIVSGLHMERQDGASDRCTVLLLEEGTTRYEMETDLIRRFLKRGDVFIFDPRGVGAVKSRDLRETPYLQMFGTEYKLNCDALMMGTSLTGLRVYDVLRACDLIRQWYPGMRIGLAGKEIGGIYALLAGVLDDRVDELYLENLLPSYESLVRTKHYKYDPRLDLYGVLKSWDIPMLLESFPDKKITRIDTPDIGIHARMRAF